MRDLNHNYRGLNSPTDVLSFSMQEGEHGDINPHLLGDVVISIETAQRQAQEQGHSLNQEVALLLIHGLLHLAGFDHTLRREAIRMEKKANELWQAIEPIVQTKGASENERVVNNHEKSC